MSGSGGCVQQGRRSKANHDSYNNDRHYDDDFDHSHRDEHINYEHRKYYYTEHNYYCRPLLVQAFDLPRGLDTEAVL